MYTPTIGLEIHAELLTESKLFCGCRNAPNEGEPNQFVCPTCLGYPGALPALNKKAVEHMLRIGVALQGTLADATYFDRKHYFYPDIPKGYQISQYLYPLVRNATLAGISIERIHLEEDTAKSAHAIAPEGSVLDFNRSGVPLMELVTTPTLQSAAEAKQFGELLQVTLRSLGVARGRMEWGEMRVEANISVSASEVLGTKVEVKNLNSFKAVEGAILYEIERQSALLDRGEEVLAQTRGWNEQKKKTVEQRSKETAAEYRYLPEPDLSELRISAVPEWSVATLKKTLPELPEQQLSRYLESGVLSEAQASLFLKHPRLASLYDTVSEQFSKIEEKRLVANYLLSDVVSYLEEHGSSVFERITAEVFHELISLLLDTTLSSRGAKDTLAHLIEHGGTPRAVAERLGKLQESNAEVLDALLDTILSEHSAVVEEYKEGKERAAQFLVGQVMKQTAGSANPKLVQELLKKKLGTAS